MSKTQEKTIEDYLKTEIDVIPELDGSKTLVEALEYLIENVLEYAVIVQGTVTLGLLSDTDLIRHRNDPDFTTRLCSDLVTMVPPLYLLPTDSMEVAAELVCIHPNVDYVLVQDRQQRGVSGILLKHDILRWIADTNKG